MTQSATCFDPLGVHHHADIQKHIKQVCTLYVEEKSLFVQITVYS